MFANTHDQVTFLTTETNAGRSGIQFDDTQQSIGLVPDSHRAIGTAWRKQSHFGAAGQTRNVIHVIRITVMIIPFWKKKNNNSVC